MITPPCLCFEVLTPATIEMKVGTRIDYRLKLRGIPIRWQSEITLWNPPHSFVDEQRRGPYRRWHHTHTFADTRNGVVVGDVVEYSVWGGSLVNKLFVGPGIEKIFAYRAQKLEGVFGLIRERAAVGPSPPARSATLPRPDRVRSREDRSG